LQDSLGRRQWAITATRPGHSMPDTGGATPAP
jgi:hypothetical protein